jgi:hypothetical protein
MQKSANPKHIFLTARTSPPSDRSRSHLRCRRRVPLKGRSATLRVPRPCRVLLTAAHHSHRAHGRLARSGLVASTQPRACWRHLLLWLCVRVHRHRAHGQFWCVWLHTRGLGSQAGCPACPDCMFSIWNFQGSCPVRQAVSVITWRGHAGAPRVYLVTVQAIHVWSV